MGKPVRINPKDPTYKGCYQYTAKNGIVTYWVYLKRGGELKKVKLGRSDAGWTPKAVREHRLKLLYGPEKDKPEDSITLDEGWERFKPMLEKTSRWPEPVASRYEHYIKPHLGRKQVARITRADIEKVRLGCIEAGLAPATRRQVWNTLSWIINWLIEKDLYTGRNPLDGIKPGSFGKRAERKRFLSVDSSDDLLTLIKTMDRVTYWKVALCRYLGLRPIELTLITPMSINWDNNTLTLRGVKSKHDDEFRTVEISRLAAPILREVEQELSGPDVGKPFFPGPKGFTNHEYGVFRKACKKLGLNDGVEPGDRVARVSPYTMRHTYASDLIESGSTLGHVQSMLGHKAISTTSIYTHIARESEKKAADRMADMIEERRRERGLKSIKGGK